MAVDMESGAKAEAALAHGIEFGVTGFAEFAGFAGRAGFREGTGGGSQLNE